MKQESKYNIFCKNDTLWYFYTHISIYQYSTFDLSYVFYNQIDMIYLQIYVHIKYTLLIFSFHSFLLSRRKDLDLNLFYLFGTNTLLDRSLKVLQLPTHRPKLTSDE